MNYVETGVPCPECGGEWVKTEDGCDGCLDCDCSMAHPSCRELNQSDWEDEHQYDKDNHEKD